MSKLNAKDVMTTSLLTAKVDWTVSQLAEFLVVNNISGAPVVNRENKLVGVVSETDIVRFDTLPVTRSDSEYPHSYYLMSLEPAYSREELESLDVQQTSDAIVGDLMTPVIFEVDEDTPVSEVARLMIRGRIHRVFVTHNGQITGLITTMDIVALVA